MSASVCIELLKDYPQAIPQIAHWYFDAWRDLYAPLTEDDVARAVAMRINIAHAPLSLVATADARVVGVVALKEHDMETRLDLGPWLAGLYVDSAWRGRGIGARLVTALERKAAAIGHRRLFLYTPDAERFYVKLGWQRCETIRYKGCVVTIMNKTFHGA